MQRYGNPFAADVSTAEVTGRPEAGNVAASAHEVGATAIVIDVAAAAQPAHGRCDRPTQLGPCARVGSGDCPRSSDFA
jgi:hypothetical protein